VLLVTVHCAVIDRSAAEVKCRFRVDTRESRAMSFANATGVAAMGDGRYRSSIPHGWDIAGNTNGGVLLAMAGRAMLDATGRTDPVSVTAHFLSPGRPGSVTIDVEVVKQGKTFGTASATMCDADGRPVIRTLGTFGNLDSASGPDHMLGAAPELPHPDECARRDPAGGFPLPFVDHVDMRLHPDDATFETTGVGSGEPVIRGWFRFPDDEPIDTVGLLLAVDAFPPTIFNLHLPVAWTPTVELTAHVRARPVPGWLRCVFRTRFVTGGFLEEDGEVWDASGRLVAQSRQLALVPRSS
jgi:acyl-CoA thioesterase